MASKTRVLIALADREAARILDRQLLTPDGYQVALSYSGADAEEAASALRPDLMFLGDDLEDSPYLDLAKKILQSQPTLPIILITHEAKDLPTRQLIQLGLVDWLQLPLQEKQVRSALKRGLERSKHWQLWLERESHRYTGQLKQQVDELAALTKAGRAVTAKLDLDDVLASVVEAATELAGADSGSILLLDEESGELSMRASRNFQEDFAQTFRLPVDDTLAGEVVKTGKPLLIEGQDPQKIKTAYLVYSIIYVPLQLHGRVIGVLSVDNKQSGKSLNQRHVSLLTAMAEYAVVAIDNAQLYRQTEIERHKLEQILTRVQDGVVVYNDEEEIILVNHTVRRSFDLGDENLAGKSLGKVFTKVDLLEAVRGKSSISNQAEIAGADQRIYSVTVTSIPEIGSVASFHDITYLKELDNLKNDFIQTVSHDIRSPLTSIMGYVNLIERSGEVNKQQADFIERVKQSADSITNLINDLLELGRAESPMEENIQPLSISPIIKETVEAHKSQIDERKLVVAVEAPNELPLINGNSLQLRQMMDNLLGNAIKYTPVGGMISVSIDLEDGQIIIQVTDSGPGIPVEEHAKIFQKFYRAKNVDKSVPGTGLGLAITKTIVDNHRGRVWVNSQIGKGSTFVVVLPAI